MTELIFRLKTVYGVERFYPVNETAIGLLQIIGKKTLTKSEVIKLKAIGLAVIVEPNTL